MQQWVTIAGLIAGIIISIIGAATSIFNWRIRRSGEIAKVGIDRATEAKIASEAARIDEEREREREEFWQEQLARAEDKCQRDKQNLEDEKRIYQTYVDRMVPWSWRVIRTLRLNDLDYDNPPDLTQIRLEIMAQRSVK